MRKQEIASLRLRNQHLVGAALATPAEVVRRLGAVQAQELPVAKWSLGARARGTTEADVDRALASGAILRTHVLRPTWHFVLPADIRWMLELTAPRVRRLMAYYDRQLSLDDALFAKSQTLMRKALAGGRALTRKELGEALGRGGIVAQGQRLGHIMLRAELDLVVCSGTPRGKQHTYALLEQRAPRAAKMGRDQAMAELARRYFTSHGPATAKDFAWWASLPVADVKRALDMVGGDLDSAVVDGLTYWFADPPRARRAAPPHAHLLQAFDEYVVAYSDSKSVFNLAGLAAPPASGRATFMHAVLVDGQVVGQWRRAPEQRAAAIETRLARSLGAAEKRALAAELDRYGRFVDGAG